MLYSIGNKKIGDDTLIINIHTATKCPAADTCLIRSKCYALANERIRPTVLAFRQRQEMLWEYMSAEYFIKELLAIKKDQYRYIRWQEAGDFANQHDVNKMSYIASELKGAYKCYTYTSRNDLDYSDKSKNLIITGSFFMVDNMFVPLNSRAHEEVMNVAPKPLHCPGDCRRCSLCKIARGNEIIQKIH